jgi:hypothetical protein
VPIKLQRSHQLKKKRKKERKKERKDDRERVVDFGEKPIMLRWPYL